ncbi:MAG: glycosyltransferase, partial [Candidatus Hodarchaeota archaeon]
MQKKPLRILMITDFFPPTVGGIESHVAMLSNQLSTHGHKVVVATIKQDNFEGSEKQCGIEIYRLKSFFHNLRFTYLDSKKKYHPPFKDPYVSEELEKLILDFKPDIIHSHGSIIFSYMPIHRKNKIPLVATLHNYSFICPRQDFFYMTKQVCDLPFTKKCYDCTTRQFGLLKSIFTTGSTKKLIRLCNSFLSGFS